MSNPSATMVSSHSPSSGTVAALAASLLQRWFPDPAAEDAPDDLSPLFVPTLSAGQRIAARAELRESSGSPLERAEALALLHYAPRLATLPAERYNRGLMLELSSRMSLPSAGALMACWPESGPGHTDARAGERSDAAAELELFAEEFACWGGTLSPWVDEETLERSTGGDQTLRRLRINAMRWLRLHEVVANHWMAETFFPRVERQPREGAVIWTVGPPLVVERLRELAEVDLILTAEDLKNAQNATQRRRQGADRVRQAVRHGMTVALVANHSTVESREELVKVAREEGVPSIAWYFDVSEAHIEARNTAAGWPATRRTVERVLEQLEAPRPHEAEQVIVVGDEGIEARWQPGQGMLDGFVEKRETSVQTNIHQAHIHQAHNEE